MLFFTQVFYLNNGRNNQDNACNLSKHQFLYIVFSPVQSKLWYIIIYELGIVRE